MNFKEFQKTFNENLYDKYTVTMCLHDIVGGTPADKNLIGDWINATNKEKSAEDRAKLVEATLENLPEVAADKEARSWVRFKQDETGVFVEGRCLKSALKEASNIVKSVIKTRGKSGTEEGTKALKSKVAECVFVQEEKIYVLDMSGNYIKECPTEERPIHVMTPTGPRASLKRYDILRDVKIEFTVLLAKTGAVSETALFSSIAYLEHLGILSDRSQGHGQSKYINVQKVV